MKIKKYTRALYRWLTDADYRFLLSAAYGRYNKMDDVSYLEKVFYARLGKKLDLDNPTTFNEKLQWLKLYDRKDIYTKMVDKYLVKEYVASIIGDEYIIPTLGVWDNVEDISWDILPEQFVLKVTHDSGGLVICKSKKNLNRIESEKKLNTSLKRDYYLEHREWPYKNVVRRIIAEKYMKDDNLSTEELTDYKFMCFNGSVKCIFVGSERYSDSGLKITFFDREWNVLPFERPYPRSTQKIDKPVNLEKMILLAEKLSKDIPFLRVDFYEVESKIYFGELTFFPGSGFEEFSPEEWDYTLGSWLQLPKEKGKF